MNQNSVFRANARAQLGGNIFANNWLMALVVCLIQSLILGIGSSLAGVVAILVGGLLAFGLAAVLGYGS